MNKKTILFFIAFISIVGSVNAIPGATGGNITTDGLYTVHTFTTNGTFKTLVDNLNVTYLIIAGGGSGGTAGGGAGGLIYNYSILLNNTNYSVVIGLGGEYKILGLFWGNNGTNSSFNNFTAIGGGGGGETDVNGRNGGSGGGSGTSTVARAGGSGITGQGNRGGNNSAVANYGSGGGGGAGGVGQNGNSTTSGYGGIGVNYSISGTDTCYAGGGGGSAINTFNGTAVCGGGRAANATNGTGGGGGGGAFAGVGYKGGNGIVIIRYITPLPAGFSSCSAVVSTNSASITCVQNVSAGSTVWIQYGGYPGKYKFRTDYQTESDSTFSKIIKGLPLQAGGTYFYKVMSSFNGVIISSSEGNFTLPAVGQITDYQFDTHTNELADNGLNITETAATIPKAYTDIVGSIFWGILFGFIFVMIWLRQEDITIPSLVGLLIGASLWALMPPDWVSIAYSLTIVSFAGLVYSLLKTKS